MKQRTPGCVLDTVAVTPGRLSSSHYLDRDTAPAGRRALWRERLATAATAGGANTERRTADHKAMDLGSPTSNAEHPTSNSQRRRHRAGVGVRIGDGKTGNGHQASGGQTAEAGAAPRATWHGAGQTVKTAEYAERVGNGASRMIE